jgi:hypothetical protein
MKEKTRTIMIPDGNIPHRELLISQPVITMRYFAAANTIDVMNHYQQGLLVIKWCCGSIPGSPSWSRHYGDESVQQCQLELMPT